MPPTNEADAIWASAIDLLAGVIGYQAAFEVLRKEFEERSEAVDRQLFSLDGALVKDIAAIAKEFPGCRVRFSNANKEMNFTISGSKSMTQAVEIKRRIDEAVDRRNPLPGISSIKAAFQGAIEEVDVPDGVADELD